MNKKACVHICTSGRSAGASSVQPPQWSAVCTVERDEMMLSVLPITPSVSVLQTEAAQQGVQSERTNSVKGPRYLTLQLQ